MKGAVCCFFTVFLLTACSPDAPSQAGVNTDGPMAEAKQSSSPGSMYGVASGLKASSQPDNGTASKGFDGLATLWSRVTGKEQDAPDEPAPATPPIKITPAAEAINPFPTLRVVHPALAGKLATAPRVLPARAGDQLEKRALEKRPGDLVERRAGDLP